jgi:hypothetical protein
MSRLCGCRDRNLNLDNIICIPFLSSSSMFLSVFFDFISNGYLWFKLYPSRKCWRSHLKTTRIWDLVRIPDFSKIKFLLIPSVIYRASHCLVRYVDNFSAGTRGSSSAEYFLRYLKCIWHSILLLLNTVSYFYQCILRFVQQSPLFPHRILFHKESEATVVPVYPGVSFLFFYISFSFLPPSSTLFPFLLRVKLSC